MAEILIVEDDLDIVAVVERALKVIGHATISAEDVVTAVELFRQVTYDLIITDYRLGSQTAQELVKSIRHDDVDVPILLMSARMEKEDFGVMIREAVDDFIEKPLDIPEFYGAVRRLLLLGEARQRTKKRAARLLEVSSKMKIGARAEAALQNLAKAVTDITPFNVVVLDLVDQAGEQLKREAAFGTESLDAPSLERLRDLFGSGYRFDIVAFVPGNPSERPRRSGSPYPQTLARENPWRPEDQILVEIRSEQKLWGFLRVADPSDALRPTEDTMRMLSLMGHNFANTLENRRAYRQQQRLSSQLGIVGEMVKTALSKPDLELVKRMLSEVAVNRFENSFACFVEKSKDGWEIDSIACSEISDYALDLDFSTESGRILESIEKDREIRHLRASHGDESLVGRQKMRSSLAIPIFTRDVLRHIFIVEDERRHEFSKNDILAYTTLADQIGLIWSSILHQKYLERTAQELNESYSKLKEANDLNVRLQNVLKRYVPASTWESVLQSSGDERVERIEALVDRAVMFIDIVGFTKLSEVASPSEIIDLLNAYFTMEASIISQMKGEVIKYIGDGIMAYFEEKRMAIIAADDIVKSQGRLNRNLAEFGVDPVRVRVGVAWGPIILGHVGPFYHQDRTLLGDVVNTASRLEHAARPGTALLDLDLLPEGDRLEDYELTRIDSIAIRGKMNPVPVMTFARDRKEYR